MAKPATKTTTTISLSDALERGREGMKVSPFRYITEASGVPEGCDIGAIYRGVGGTAEEGEGSMFRYKGWVDSDDKPTPVADDTVLLIERMTGIKMHTPASKYGLPNDNGRTIFDWIERRALDSVHTEETVDVLRAHGL